MENKYQIIHYQLSIIRYSLSTKKNALRRPDTHWQP